jgi:pimeloyl-ACP methyl ester carboxylesterase
MNASFGVAPARRLLAAAITLSSFAAAAAAAETGWERAGAEAAVAGAADVRETRWESARPPGGTYDRIRVHRYRGEAPPRAALLYLPGTNMNGHVAVSDEDHNLWIFLARRGVEVFALDYRTDFVPNTGVADLGFMEAWGIDAFGEDIRAALALARRESGKAKVFVGGFSRGAFFTYGAAGLEPESVAGLVVLDGPFKVPTPRVPFDKATELQKLRDSKAWGSDVSGALGWDNRYRLLSAAAATPGAPATDARFPNIGSQAEDLLQNAWGPGGLTNLKGGLAKVDVVGRLLVGYDRYYPAIQNVEGRALGEQPDDPATRLDDKWGEWSVPILYFGSTGMGPEFVLDGVYSAARSGSKDVTLNILQGFGHLDVVVGEKAKAQVFEPTLAWILARAQ